MKDSLALFLTIILITSPIVLYIICGRVWRKHVKLQTPRTLKISICRVYTYIFLTIVNIIIVSAIVGQPLHRIILLIILALVNVFHVSMVVYQKNYRKKLFEIVVIGDSRVRALAHLEFNLASAMLVGGFLGYWIDHWLDTKPWGMIILFYLGFQGGLENQKKELIEESKKQEIKQQEEDKKRQIELTIQTHIKTLHRKWIQLTVEDEYGVIDYSPWWKEIERFYRTVVLPSHGEVADFAAIISRKIEVYDFQQPRNVPIIITNDMNPYDFEMSCAEILSEIGWTAYATKKSGDQGADVIAEKNGIKIIIQCKLYSKPIGNKAVQEAYAAQTHEFANAAAVVTNQSFTTSARQLAKTTKISLLHYTELQEWANSLSL